MATSPEPNSWLVCIDVDASGGDQGSAVTRTPDCAVIRFTPELLDAVARSIAAAGLIEANTSVPTVRVSMPVGVALFDGIPMCEKHAYRGEGVPWLKQGETFDFIDSSIVDVASGLDSDDDIVATEWTVARSKSEEPTAHFKPSSFWLDVDQTEIVVVAWEKHGDDELRMRMHPALLQGMREHLRDLVDGIYAQWGIPENMRPHCVGLDTPQSRERQRG